MDKKRKLKINRKTGREAELAIRNLHNRNEPEDDRVGSGDVKKPVRPKRGKLTKTSSRRRRARRKMLMILLISLLSIVGIVASFVLIFRVDGVVVEGDTIYNNNELIDMVPIEKEDNIFFFDPVAVEKSILEKFIYIESVEVTRKLPSTIVISVEPEKEKYMIETGTDIYILSESLTVLRMAEDGDMFCNIVGYDPDALLIGNHLISKNEERDYMLTLLLQELANAEILEKVVEINIVDTLNMEFIYDGRITVKLGSDLSMDYKMELVAKVLTENIQESEIGTIDASVSGTAVFNAI